MQVLAPLRKPRGLFVYVNLSLLLIIIHELLILDGLLGAVDMDVEPELLIWWKKSWKTSQLDGVN